MMQANFAPVVLCEKAGDGDTMQRLERSMIEKGNFEEASGTLESLAGTSPETARLYLDLGIARYGMMEYDKACEYFKQAEDIGAEKDISDILSFAVSNVENNRDTLEAIEEADRMLRDGREEEGTLMESMVRGHLAMMHQMLERKYYYPAFITPHVIWLKENTHDLPGLYTLSADIYYSAMFYDKAAEDYEKAIEDDPENARLYRSYADCLVAKGDYAAADERYRDAIGLYLRQGLKADSAEIKRLMEIKAALPKRYEDISTLVEQGRFTEAEEMCRKRISLNPSDYAAITQLGEIYWKKGDRRAAIKLFRKVVRRAPDYPTAHFYLGKAYFFERKHEKALKEFDVFKEKMDLMPEMSEETVDFYVAALHYISYMYSTLKRYGDVMKENKKILDLRPGDQTAHFNAAVCYYRYYHNLSKAYGELNKVIGIDPASDTADKARYFMDYMRSNPDSRLEEDFNFIYKE